MRFVGQGAGLNMKRFAHGKDPIARDLANPRAQPSDAKKREERLEHFRRRQERADTDAERLAWGTQVVLEEARGVDGAIDKEFLDDFYAWLQGTGKHEDHKRTPWGRKNLENLPGVHELLNEKLLAKRRFNTKLALMDEIGPKNVGEAFQVFKHRVRQQVADDDDLRVYEQSLQLSGAEPPRNHPRRTDDDDYRGGTDPRETGEDGGASGQPGAFNERGGLHARLGWRGERQQGVRRRDYMGRFLPESATGMDIDLAPQPPDEAPQQRTRPPQPLEPEEMSTPGVTAAGVGEPNDGADSDTSTVVDSDDDDPPPPPPPQAEAPAAKAEAETDTAVAALAKQEQDARLATAKAKAEAAEAEAAEARAHAQEVTDRVSRNTRAQVTARGEAVAPAYPLPSAGAARPVPAIADSQPIMNDSELMAEAPAAKAEAEAEAAEARAHAADRVSRNTRAQVTARGEAVAPAYPLPSAGAARPVPAIADSQPTMNDSELMAEARQVLAEKRVRQETQRQFRDGLRLDLIHSGRAPSPAIESLRTEFAAATAGQSDRELFDTHAQLARLSAIDVSSLSPFTLDNEDVENRMTQIVLPDVPTDEPSGGITSLPANVGQEARRALWLVQNDMTELSNAAGTITAELEILRAQAEELTARRDESTESDRAKYQEALDENEGNQEASSGTFKKLQEFWEEKSRKVPALLVKAEQEKKHAEMLERPGTITAPDNDDDDDDESGDEESGDEEPLDTITAPDDDDDAAPNNGDDEGGDEEPPEPAPAPEPKPAPKPTRKKRPVSPKRHATRSRTASEKATTAAKKKRAVPPKVHNTRARAKANTQI